MGVYTGVVTGSRLNLSDHNRFEKRNRNFKSLHLRPRPPHESSVPRLLPPSETVSTEESSSYLGHPLIPPPITSTSAESR